MFLFIYLCFLSVLIKCLKNSNFMQFKRCNSFHFWSSVLFYISCCPQRCVMQDLDLDNFTTETSAEFFQRQSTKLLDDIIYDNGTQGVGSISEALPSAITSSFNFTINETQNLDSAVESGYTSNFGGATFNFSNINDTDVVLTFTAAQPLATESETKSSNDAIGSFGCFTRKPRVLIPEYTFMNTPVSTIQARPSIGPCASLCRQGSGQDFFTFAMWLPKAPYRQTWDCYCGNDVIPFFDKISEQCDQFNTSTVQIHFTCPTGYFAPPLCQPRCPNYCNSPKLSTLHCYYNGSCLYDCEMEDCITKYNCQILEGATGLSENIKQSFLTSVVAGVLIFLDMRIQVAGWVSRVRYLSYRNSTAYLSAWRLHTASSSWQLVGKIRLTASSGSRLFHQIPLNETIYVEEGDYLGIHQDGSVIPQNKSSDIQKMFTLFQWYEVDDIALAYLQTFPKFTSSGIYVWSDQLDDDWVDQQIFSSSNFVLSTLSQSKRVYPDLDVVLRCNCPDSCDGTLCQPLGLGRCQHGCRPGYVGQGPCRVCPHGYYSTNCSKTCFGCKDKSCIPWSGACHSGCAPDVMGPMCSEPCPRGTYGLGCNLKCSNNCLDGVCTTFGCECSPGYRPPTCQERCESGTWGNCSFVCGHCEANKPCDIMTGHCRKCASGYRSPFCTEPCPLGFYGANCNKPCGNCSEGFPCNPATGYCPEGCVEGYQPPYCEGGCRTGHYGPQCQYLCDYCYRLLCNEQGYCKSYCASGLKKPDCKEPCDIGTYGLGCARTCGKCAGGQPCDPVTGQCPVIVGESICLTGFWGPECIMPCGECYEGAPCDDVDGACPNGWCSDPYLPPPRCSRFGRTLGECSPGMYGPGCRFACGHCDTNQTCESKQGHCPNGCTVGYQPPLCQEHCAKGYWGATCSTECGFCRDREPCHPETGECRECEPGFVLPMCVSPCRLGYYGLGCKFECGACQEYTACDAITGQCLEGCVEGYVGLLCKYPRPFSPQGLALLTSGAQRSRFFVVVIILLTFCIVSSSI